MVKEITAYIDLPVVIEHIGFVVFNTREIHGAKVGHRYRPNKKELVGQCCGVEYTTRQVIEDRIVLTANLTICSW